ncbi:hypothetical protein FSZ31_02740 [Sphingorhabdus soli]|uniref:Uncharacterized protein n=1 Tax=Flavisphingopyxis soli TaxID=2601267 RepID=A0A5C6UKN6_9SPHN|nr:hypothetical protein [Sphingorhabdus soli]TXC73673.1 hypothetical protein FSZ31_02740 [Sphingorhabdus soli]
MNLLQIIGSLVAVLAVIAAVKLLGLGRAQLAGPSEACENAEAMVHGFTATDAIVCGEGNGALVAGDKGDFVVLKRLGSYYAARKLLPPISTAERDDTVLHIESGDRYFGRVNLTFPDAASRTAWQQRLEHSA